MKKIILLAFILCLLSCNEKSKVTISREQENKTSYNTDEITFDYSHIESYHPKNGIIPDKETAEKIAETILMKIYGDQILDQKPFHVTLKDSVWLIEGTLPNNYEKGGVAYIELNKQNGEVLKIIHTK